MTGNADIAKGLTEALGLTTKSVRQTMSDAIQKIMGKGVAASEENIDKLPKKQADVVRQLIANFAKIRTSRTRNSTWWLGEIPYC